MSGYLTGVIITAALISLALAAAYKETADKAVRTALMIFLVYVTVMPLVGAAKDFDLGDFKTEISETEDESGMKRESERAFANGIALFLAEEFSLNTKDIRVTLSGFDYRTMRAEGITVNLSGEAVFSDFKAIKERIEKNGLGECDVKIENR